MDTLEALREENQVLIEKIERLTRELVQARVELSHYRVLEGNVFEYVRWWPQEYGQQSHG